MSEELRNHIKDFSDQQLLEQYTQKQKEYTDEAIAIMKEELSLRNISDEQIMQAKATSEKTAHIHDVQDFVAFEHYFDRTDLLLAQAILREREIPFIIESASSSDTFPLESESNRLFILYVHKDHLAKAHEGIEHHFEKDEGVYKIKYASIKDRLKAFQFHEVRFSESEMEEEVDVSFTPTEEGPILGYCKRLEDEADRLEQEQDRVVFNYDNLDTVCNKLGKKNTNSLTLMDLLTIVEVLQIYCDEPNFPPQLEKVAENLLDFLQTRAA
ncbi:MAG: hypothetical protein ACOC4C_00250 [Fibrobacterota bacterium]